MIFYEILVVVLEIEERKHFLDQMATLGKRKEYQQLISNEIADVSMIEKWRGIKLLFVSLFYRKYAKWNSLIGSARKLWKNA